MERDGDRWRLIALCVLGFLAPFNVVIPQAGDVLRQPLVVVALVVGGIAALSGWLANRDLSTTQRWFLGLWFAWMGLLWVATLLSPDTWLSSGAALRISVAAVVMAATVLIVKDSSQMTPVLRAIVVGAVLAVLLGATVQLLGRDFSETDRFSGAVTRLGPYDRLTRPWSHANVAALAIGVSIAGVAAIRSAFVRSVVAVVFVVGIVLTYSRGGFLSLGVGAIAWIVLRMLTGRGGTAERVWLGALVAVGIAAAVGLPGWTGRVAGEDRLDWWQVELDVPESVQLGDEPIDTMISITNISPVVWPRAGDEPVRIAARWVVPGTETVRGEHRWALPSDVAPGDEIGAYLAIDPTVPNGTYDLHWDLLIEDLAYFQQFAGLPATISQAQVTNSSLSDSAPPQGSLVAPRQFPGRIEIWSASFEAFAGSPLFGVGPGRLSDTMAPDAGASHSHNIVLEPLATWGILASLPFFALIFGGLVRAWQTARRRSDLLSAAIATGLVISTAHGLVDWSFVHVSVAIPLGFLLGLAWATPPTIAERRNG